MSRSQWNILQPCFRCVYVKRRDQPSFIMGIKKEIKVVINYHEKVWARRGPCNGCWIKFDIMPCLDVIDELVNGKECRFIELIPKVTSARDYKVANNTE